MTGKGTKQLLGGKQGVSFTYALDNLANRLQRISALGGLVGGTRNTQTGVEPSADEYKQGHRPYTQLAASQEHHAPSLTVVA